MDAKTSSIVLVAATTALACGSTATDVCDLICECEHCSDLTEAYTCRDLEYRAEVAEIYDCTSEFEDWASCFEEQGTCQEKEARYTTSELGRCSATQDTGLDCSLDANVCSAIPEATCEGGSCQVRACDNGTGQQCTSDEQCPQGPDKCEDARRALLDCEAAASDVNPNLEQPQPDPDPQG